MEKKDFASRLSELRIEKGLSARDLSLSLGQSAGYINNIENGNNYPSMSTFFYICEYLVVSSHEFFNVENKAPLKVQEFLKLCENLDGSEIDILISMAEKMNQNKR